MWRALKYLVIVGIIAALFVWFANHPGSFRLDWRGYRIQSTAAGLFAAVFLIALAAAGLYRLWVAIVRTPGNIKRSMENRRLRKGYGALTQGMVAVAAGDAPEAQKHRRRAERLLSESPLTMLLSAQAAQLAGDDKAAERFFTAMLERRETRFLGLRGLLTQATKSGSAVKALEIAEKARREKPNSAWVAEHLYDLQTREGRWREALATLTDARKRHRAIITRGDRHLATLDVMASEEAEKLDDRATAMKLAMSAVKRDPANAPAVTRLVSLHRANGRTDKAAKVLERAWSRDPHPSFVKPYVRLKAPGDKLEALKVVQRLVRQNADHRESQLAIAEAALDAELWGEAGTALEKSLKGDTGRTRRYCHLRAKLEESENGDPAKARRWLLEAAQAEPDPVWTCRVCGNAVEFWTALCGNCGAFDSFDWAAPRRVARNAAETAELHNPPAMIESDGENPVLPAPSGG